MSSNNDDIASRLRKRKPGLSESSAVNHAPTKKASAEKKKSADSSVVYRKSTELSESKLLKKQAQLEALAKKTQEDARAKLGDEEYTKSLTFCVENPPTKASVNKVLPFERKRTKENQADRGTAARTGYAYAPEYVPVIGSGIPPEFAHMKRDYELACRALVTATFDKMKPSEITAEMKETLDYRIVMRANDTIAYQCIWCGTCIQCDNKNERANLTGHRKPQGQCVKNYNEFMKKVRRLATFLDANPLAQAKVKEGKLGLPKTHALYNWLRNAKGREGKNGASGKCKAALEALGYTVVDERVKE